MKKTKRMIPFLLAAAMLLSACGGGGNGKETTGDDNTVTTTPGTEEPKETVDPKADLDLDTKADGADGTFYDAFPTGDAKWAVNGNGGTVSAKDGAMTVRIKTYGSDTPVERKGFLPLDDRFEISFRLKIISGGRHIGFVHEFGGSRIFMYIYPDSIFLRGADGAVYDDLPLDIGNEWHEYRMVSDGENVHYYVDGKYVISAAPQNGSYSGKMRFFASPIAGTDTEFLVDYVRYSSLKGRISISDIENGAEYPDSARLSLSVNVDRDIPAGEVVYRANGVKIGSSDRKNIGYPFDWENIKPGKYYITAELGENVSYPVAVTLGKPEAVSVGTAEGVTSTSDRLYGSYELVFDVKGDGKLTSDSGMNRAELAFSGGEVTLPDGSRTAAGDGNYILLADGETGWLYRGGRLIAGFVCPISSGKAGVTYDGGVSGVSVRGFNPTYYTPAGGYTALDSFGKSWVLSVMTDAGKDSSVILSDGFYKCRLTVSGGKLYGGDAPKNKAELRELAVLPAGKNVLEVRCVNGIALIYSGGKWLGSLRLPATAERPYAEISGAECEIRGYADRYYLDLDFVTEDYKDYLTFTGSCGAENGRLSLSDCTAVGTQFARFCDFTVKADLGGKKTGGFWLLSGWSELYGVRGGYDLSSGKYSLYLDGKLLASVTGDTPAAVTEMTLSVSENGITLSVDGKAVLHDDAVPTKWGACGVKVDGEAAVTSMSYRGDGFPQASRFFTDRGKSEYPDIVELEGGRLLMTEEGYALYSDDGGTTWEKLSGDTFGKNSIVLSSGRLLTVKRSNVSAESMTIDLAYLSDDGGKTFKGPFQLQGKASYRIAMNCKLTQAESGRVFFVTGESGHGVEHAAVMGIYYSDNDGMTWKKIETEISYETTGMNLQEGVIVDLGNGTLRFYARSDRGFLYYSDSTDNGMTFDTDFRPAPFAAVCSAFNVERDRKTGELFMAWEYNCTNDHGQIQYPRTRVALAVSRDKGQSWEYLADVDDYSNAAAIYHFNIGVNVTEKYVFVTVIRAVPEGRSWVNHGYIMRYERAKLTALPRFTPLHSLTAGTFRSDYYSEVLGNSVIARDGVISAGEKRYDGGKFEGNRTLIPLEYIADLIKGEYAGGKITLGSSVWKFTEGADFCGDIGMQDKAAMSGGKLSITVRDAAAIFGLSVEVTDAYAAIFAAPYGAGFGGVIGE